MKLNNKKKEIKKKLTLTISFKKNLLILNEI